jgi:hypothetical protein
VASLTDPHAPLNAHNGIGQLGRGQRNGPYWLRSSRESELEWRISQLRSGMDLRVLMEQVQGDAVCLARCHGILLESLIIFSVGAGDFGAREGLRAMDLAALVGHAGKVGFWNTAVLPGLHGQQGTP